MKLIFNDATEIIVQQVESHGGLPANSDGWNYSGTVKGAVY